jgi:hypothetical protein
MTEYGLPFDGLLVGDASIAPYSATEWARQWQLRHGIGASFPNYGVFKGSGSGNFDPLAVQETTIPSANVEIEIGAALVNGRFYETTAAVLVSVAANASGNPRIDTIVLRIDYVAQTIRLVRLQGTPAGSPVRPTLTQNTTTWEMPLADIAVANGFSTIVQANIKDRRRAVQFSSNGWLPYVWPINYLPNGTYPTDQTGGSVAFSSNASVAVPFALTGNLALQSVTFRAGALALRTTIITWAIYTQDVNDENTAENTLRRVALVDNGTVNYNPGNVTMTASPAPIILTPGIYWLVMKNSNSPSFSLGAIAATGSSFSDQNSFMTHTNPTLGQTLDFVTGWSKSTAIPGVRLNGRVFGQTTAF